jgi:hypothetical protein
VWWWHHSAQPPTDAAPLALPSASRPRSARAARAAAAAQAPPRAPWRELLKAAASGDKTLIVYDGASHNLLAEEPTTLHAVRQHRYLSWTRAWLNARLDASLRSLGRAVSAGAGVPVPVLDSTHSFLYHACERCQLINIVQRAFFRVFRCARVC